jgi:competence protein ComEA
VVGEQIRESFAERVQELRSDRRVAGALLACVALAAGIAWWRASAAPASVPAAAPSTTSSAASTVVATSTTNAETAVVVDVVGAVRAPGVVKLSTGARVVDAIAAVGGAKANADLARLNLAAVVADGARIAVPAFGEPAPAVDPAAVTESGVNNSTSESGGSAHGPVNLNTATEADLDSLPGIGPATAAAIVADRAAHGPFAAVDDLARVRGIGDAKLAQLRDLVTVS